jgi:hypothetical protein
MSSRRLKRRGRGHRQRPCHDGKRKRKRKWKWAVEGAKCLYHRCISTCGITWLRSSMCIFPVLIPFKHIITVWCVCKDALSAVQYVCRWLTKTANKTYFCAAYISRVLAQSSHIQYHKATQTLPFATKNLTIWKRKKERRKERSLLIQHRRSPELQLRQTRLSRALGRNPSLLCTNPRRRIHVDPIHHKLALESGIHFSANARGKLTDQYTTPAP